MKILSLFNIKGGVGKAPDGWGYAGAMKPLRRSALPAALLLLASSAPAQLLNGGFEEDAFLVAFPTQFGLWGVDLVAFVGADQGVEPAEGEQMVRFEATTLGTGGVGTVADIWNLADVEPWRALVEAGHARVRASALCNRVAGDACTDTRFGLQLQAHAGAPETYPDEWADPLVASPLANVLSDGDPATWEALHTAVELPAATDFVAVVFSLVEDVCPTDLPPFDGHYGDAVTLAVDAWLDGAPGTPDGAGEPSLTGFGTLGAGDEGWWWLTDVPAAAPGLLFVAVGDTAPLPLFGGALVAHPAAATLPFVAGSTGVRVPYLAPSFPPGTTVTVQAAVTDGATPFGAALSNAVEGLRP